MNSGAYGHKPKGCNKTGFDHLHVTQIILKEGRCPEQPKHTLTAAAGTEERALGHALTAGRGPSDYPGGLMSLHC